MEDLPLPDDASPTALSPGYVATFNPEEDPKDDPANYPIDGGDDVDDESSDNDDDHEEEQEASDDHDEEEEHPAPTDSSVVPIDDLLPLTEDTKAFETDESAATPVPSPRRPHATATKALIVAVAAALPSSPPPSPLNPLLSQLPQIPSPPLPVPSPLLPPPSPPTYTSPTYDEAPLGYRASRIRLRAASPPTHHPLEIPLLPLLLPSTSHKDDLLEADMSLRKRAYFTAPASEFEVRESSTAAARQPVLDVATVDAIPGSLVPGEVGYGIEDVWDDMIRDMKEKAPTTVEGLSQRVTDLSTTLARDTHKTHIRLEDAQDDRALQRSRAMDCNRAVHAELQAYRAQVQTHETHIQTRDARIGSLETLVATLVAQTSSLQT
ncbi:hypothetical protein Tco_1298322 [Tanacetum coccineum]